LWGKNFAAFFAGRARITRCIYLKIKEKQGFFGSQATKLLVMLSEGYYIARIIFVRETTRL